MIIYYLKYNPPFRTNFKLNNRNKIIMKAIIFQKNLLNKNEQTTFKFVENFDEAEVVLSNNSIRINTKDAQVHNYQLIYLEKDVFTETFLGQFENGSTFRLIKPIDFTLNITKLKTGAADAFSFGSIDPRGWAIHFYLFNN